MVQDRIYKYFERNPLLHVLFIFDKMGIIQNELEDVDSWEEGYIYKVFDGAWFNTKYAIETTWKDNKVVLLFTKDRNPSTEEEQLKFPLLDMLKANMEYKEEDYASFMQQYNLPEKFRSFIKRNIGEIMSSRVNTLLNGYLTKEAFSEDVVCRAFISNYLGEKKLLDWENIIVKMIILEIADEKKRGDFYNRLANTPDARNAVDGRLTKLFGRSFNILQDHKLKEVAESLKYNSITQLLSVASTDNYKAYKVTNSLILDQMNKIYDCGTHDRLLSGKFVEALSSLAQDIKEEEIIKVYGIDAQYFILTESLCWPILTELLETKLLSDPSEVNERVRELSLKMPESSSIQVVFRFMERIALYYDKVRDLGTLKLNTPEEYVQKYMNEFYVIDYFYRGTLEAYHELITKDLPIIQEIHKVKKQLDVDYSTITNVLNLEWLTCVKETGDSFSSISLTRQEDFFKNENDPSLKQVVIISDALRYEVAAELMQSLSKEKHMASLGAMLSMLPTETKYCKPVLLPHRTLELQGTELWVDGQVLSTTEQRTAHVDRYRKDAYCIKYEELMNGDIMQMRELFKRPLVYIFHDTIDEASHSQSPFEVITACRKAIEQLTVLIKRLHATWNVNNVILTADHGFIYNDITFQEKDKHSINEVCLEKKTRYYLTNSKEEVEGIIKFHINTVSGIAAPVPTMVAVPLGTNRLAAPGGYNFAHGGATLQEMIVPVIKSQLRKVKKTEKVGVSLMSRNLNMVSSRLKFQIIQSEAVSMTMMERRIVCCVYENEKPVTAEKEFDLKSTDATNLNNRVYDVTLNLNASVSSGVLQLRIYDVEDRLNPLIRENVKNNTLIETDF